MFKDKSDNYKLEKGDKEKSKGKGKSKGKPSKGNNPFKNALASVKK